ncbi:hypothetical protein [Streptomyces sp. NPDC003480]
MAAESVQDGEGGGGGRALPEHVRRFHPGDPGVAEGLEHAVDVGVLPEEPAVADSDGVGGAGGLHRL